MAVLAPISGLPRFFNGRIVTTAVAYFYDAGTTTPRAVFEAAGGAAHPNPVPVDGSGNFPAIYIEGEDAYKIRVENGSGVLLGEYDDLSGDITTVDAGGGGGGTTIPTGFEMLAYTTGVVAGWVRENGRTIGSAASAATERANDDTEDLFLHLWDIDANLAVSGGRGASAASDWAANKTIALPDAKGRILVGLDDMGATAAGRLSGGTFAFGSATALGSYGGVATNTLLTANLPAHSHTASTSTNGAHTHGGTGVDLANHTHTYTQPSGTASFDKNLDGLTGTAVTGTTAGVATSTESATHTHDINSDGGHTHTITVNNTGSGTAVNNLQPFSLRTIYIKL